MSYFAKMSWSHDLSALSWIELTLALLYMVQIQYYSEKSSEKLWLTTFTWCEN